MTIAITSKRLFDGTGSPPIEGGVLLIEDDHIVQVGKPEQVTIPAEAEVMDCSDQTLLPGLIDSHTHVVLKLNEMPEAGTPSVSTQMHKDTVRMALRASMNMRDDLKSGVTTMRALGDPEGIDFRIRDAIEAGDIPGPRLLVAGRALRPSHGWGVEGVPPADGVDQIRAAVRQNIAMGADVIKIFVTNFRQGMSDEAYMRADLTRVPIYTKEEIEAAVDEAHRVGVKIAAHALGGPGLRDALEAGVDSIEHANLMEEQDIEIFLKTGAWLSDPNMVVIFDEIGLENLTWWRSPEWQRKVNFARENTRALIPKAIKAGVKFALGVDPCHGFLWKEAAYTVELGVPEMDVLLAITRNGAELLGIEDKVGTLEAGKLADVISVKGNPLDNIKCLRNVGLIMKGGKRYDQLL
jgi:imidazolonepropionase-like amidohydrolase